MKYVFVLIFGLVLGIGGELLIPTSYRFGQTVGCLQDGKYVLMPSAHLYVPKEDEQPYSLSISQGYVPSYRFFWALLTKEAKWLSSEECNKKREMIYNYDKTSFCKVCR